MPHRFVFILSSLLFLIDVHAETAKKICPKLTTTDFTQVNVQGAINVGLHTGYKQASVYLQGDPRDLKNIVVDTKGYTLSIIMRKKPLYGPISADIRAHTLTTFRYKGMGQIVGNQLHTSQLDLFINNKGSTNLAGSIGLTQLKVAGNGSTSIRGVIGRNLTIQLKNNPKVYLSGMINVGNIDMKANSCLTLDWVNSFELSVRAAGKSKLQLAGIANKIDIELWDKAQFKGRYLRAKTSFVKTHDHARAEITTLNRQHTLALDASDIYYYKTAQYAANFMGDNGAVLDFECPGYVCPK